MSEVDRLKALPYAGFSPNADERSGVDFIDPKRSQPGFNLYTVHYLCMAELIDEHGQLIHRWKAAKPGAHWAHVTLLPDGDLIVVGAENSPNPQTSVDDETRYLMRIGWDSRVRWQQSINAHHEAVVAPDGHIAALTLERRPGSEIGAKLDFRDDGITLLNAADGSFVSNVSILEMLRSDPSKLKLGRGVPKRAGGSGWIDLLHTNSLEFFTNTELAKSNPLYALENVLICFRNQNSIAIVNPQKRSLIWAWGQGELYGPHDASLLPNGNILIFDNGTGRGWSRAVEVDPRTNKIIWQYQAPHPSDFYSNSKGSCQRLANGNTLIGNADNGQAFEVTTAGDIVWNYYVPHHNDAGQRAAIVRCYRYDHDYIDSIIRKNGGVTHIEEPPARRTATAPVRAKSQPARPVGSRPASTDD